MANWTIGAIRIQLNLQQQATAVVGDRAVGQWGIGLFAADAFTAGAASLPDPSADDADWMAHGGFSIVADVAAVISQPRFSEIKISNDSMRKVRENSQTLALIMRATTLNDPIQIFITGRVLFLLR